MLMAAGTIGTEFCWFIFFTISKNPCCPSDPLIVRGNFAAADFDAIIQAVTFS
jgi:hypothetical protein